MTSKLFSQYLLLTKPGIIRGNLITFSAGFFLASQGSVDLWLFIFSLLGLSFIIASGCVANNLLDADLDDKMERTKKRIQALNTITKRNAYIFSILLGFAGVIILYLFSTTLALIAALVGWIVYVVLYTNLKRRFISHTLIGSIAGAMPPVVGYTAVVNQIDNAALILFTMLFLWQMPHFYAIGIYRLEDYRNAGVAILPLRKGIEITKKHILFYVIAYLFSTLLLNIFGYTGQIYLWIVIIIGLIWTFMAIRGLKTRDDTAWAKKMFRFSLLVLTLTSLIMVLDYIPL